MWKAILLAFVFLQVLKNASSASKMKCPPFNSIPGCYCMENSYLFRGPYVSCSDVQDTEDLQNRLTHIVDYPIEALQLYNASLTNFPRSGIFQGLYIEYLWLDSSNFKSLAPQGTKGQSPFAGLENSLKQIKLDGLLDLESVDWSELNGFGKLQRIEVTRCNLGVIDDTFASLPSSMQTLYLFDGKVKSIAEGAFASGGIRNVAVMANPISRLDRNIFSSNPTNLTSVSFSPNEIKEISDDFFSNLPSVNFADISRNKLTKLPSSLKDNWNNIKQVYVAGNPLVCDCDLVWLWKAAKSSAAPPFYNDLDFVKCGSPASLRGRELKSLEESDLCPSNQ